MTSNSVANTLSVVGSIGGVASAVSNLAGLASSVAQSWEGSLRQASYGGVPFGIEAVRTSAGRRTTVHTYPFRDDVWVEDLGQKPRHFEVIGFLVENDMLLKTIGGQPVGSVVAQRDDLLAVCEDPGATTLIHPTLGTIRNVVCLSVETTERRDLGRVFEIRLTLIVSGERRFPTTTPSNEDESDQNAAKTQIAALADFVTSTASAIQAGAAVLEQAVSTVVGWYQIATTAINDVKRIIGAVSTLAGNFGSLFGGANNGYAGTNAQASPATTASDLLAAATAARASVVAAGPALAAAAANPSDSAKLSTAIQSLLTTVTATANDPADAVRLISSLAKYSPSPITTPGQVGAASSTVQVALSALLRRYALAQLAVTLTTYQPASQNEANAVLSSAIGLYDDEITVAGDAGDDQSYQALRALKRSAIADMTTRGADLSAISTFSFQTSLPSLVLANRIYRDPTREPGLVQQAKPRHPAFMPISFDALSK